MLRAFLLSLTLATTGFFLACSEGAEDPISSADEITAAGKGSCPEDIQDLIDVLFPGVLRNPTTQQCNNVERQLNSGETDDAIGKVFDLIGFILDHHADGRLNDPNGSAPPTTEEAVAELINLLLALVGLDPIFPAVGLGDPDFAAEICEAGEECEVVTDTKFAGLRATFLEQVLVIISRLADDPGPFEEFGFDDFPLFYDISTTGASSSNSESFGLALAQDTPVEPGAVAGVCVVDPPDPFAPDPEIVDDLRLAHVIQGEEGPEVEILPLADADFLDCSGAATEGPEIGLLRSWQRRATDAFEPVSEFLVAPLFASPGRLGGAISAFSPFGAVDQTTGGEEPEPEATSTTLSVPEVIDFGAQGTATASVFEDATEDPVTSGDVEFVLDPGEEGEESVTKSLDETGQASATIQCPSESPGEADFFVDFSQHTIVARFLGTATHAASESEPMNFICTD